MNHQPFDDSPSVPNSSDADRCLLYLCGDLLGEPLRDFEEQLVVDPQLQNELTQQAAVLAHLGETPISWQTPCDVPIEPLATSAESFARQWSMPPWAWGCVGVAATVWLAAWLFWQTPTSPLPVTQEETMDTPRLAVAWLEARDLVSRSSDEELPDGFAIDSNASPESNPSPWEAFAGSSATAPPDWMVAALSAMETTEQASTETADG